MIPFRVDAISTVSARIIPAFVHVDTTVLWITLEASFAHAPWWVTWGALCVNTTRETIARILAKISI